MEFAVEALWLLVAISLALWIHQDARHRPDLRLMGPTAWALATLVLFPVTLPLYLWSRRPQPQPASEGAEGEPQPPARMGHWSALPAAVMVAFVAGLLLGAPSKASRTVLGRPAVKAPQPVMLEGRQVTPLSVDGLRYWVGRARRQPVIRHQLDATKATGEFVLIDLGVESDGDTPRLIPSSRLYLIDALGRRYSTSLEGETALLFQTGKSLFLEPAQPQLRRWGQVVFDVPKDARALTLEVVPLNFWEPVSQAKL